MTIPGVNAAPSRSTVYIGLGSNMDAPQDQLARAVCEIGELPETALKRVSSFYRTAPVGITDQAPFVNAVAELASALSPHELLKRLVAIELRHGRVRRERNGPRTLDLDILLCDTLVMDDALLTTPHPRMHERAFVLVPLVEIAPDVRIPGKGYARDCLAGLDRSGVVKLVSGPAATAPAAP
jgi:2-amino-4-hydroxy-6-hydroxymethyldihydropteridine diphosphokinase